MLSWQALEQNKEWVGRNERATFIIRLFFRELNFHCSVYTFMTHPRHLPTSYILKRRSYNLSDVHSHVMNIFVRDKIVFQLQKLWRKSLWKLNGRRNYRIFYGWWRIKKWLLQFCVCIIEMLMYFHIQLKIKDRYLILVFLAPADGRRTVAFDQMKQNSMIWKNLALSDKEIAAYLTRFYPISSMSFLLQRHSFAQY